MAYKFQRIILLSKDFGDKISIKFSKSSFQCLRKSRPKIVPIHCFPIQKQSAKMMSRFSGKTLAVATRFSNFVPNFQKNETFAANAAT